MNRTPSTFGNLPNLKLQKKPLRTQAYEALRRAITRGELQPGQRLNEGDLASHLGISRTPAREALMQLERDGLVTIDPGKGAVVCEISQEDLREIYPILAVLESLAARTAVGKISPEDMARLKELNRRLELIALKKDAAAYLETNTQFHQVFIDSCGNQTLRGIIDGFKDRIFRFRLFYLQMPNRMNNSVKEHTEIIAAFEKGDSQLAGELVKRHIEQAVNSLNTIWKKEKILRKK